MLSLSEVEILSALETQEKFCTASEIADIVSRSRSRVSSILKSLADRGVLTRKRTLSRVYYKLDPERYKELQKDQRVASLLTMAQFQSEYGYSAIRQLFFDFKKDMGSLYRMKEAIKAVNTLKISPKRENIAKYIEAFTYPVIEEIWEVLPGVYTNFHFDIYPLRSDPDFLRALVSLISAEYDNVFRYVDGIICSNYRVDYINSVTGVFTRDSIPLSTALSIKYNIPLVVFTGDKLIGEIKENGKYIIIEDAPISGREIVRVFKKIKRKTKNVKAFIILTRGKQSLEELTKNDIEYTAMFSVPDIIKDIFPHITSEYKIY